MEKEQEDLREVVLEELKRLGLEESIPEESQKNKKKGHVNHGAKLLGINTSNKTHSTGNSTGATGSKSTHLRPKNKTGKRSPRIMAQAKSPHFKSNNRTGSAQENERKYKSTPKSPFALAKRKAQEHRKQMGKDKITVSPCGHVFGQQIEKVPSVCVYMSDGTQVTVAEFLVDVCNFIRRNITVEGIFRKAGSSQRQSDLKKLIDSKKSLPSNVHVIDAACLFKQFLRCLPQPLLPPDVHSKIVKCMNLPEESRVEAITICTLLLPKMHRSTLIYIMDFLTEVVCSSEHNLMDAHNLAIVLAPNLLPTTISPTFSRKNFQSLPSEDSLLTTNIEIIQLMIQNGSRICRLPTSLALALENRLETKSNENQLASEVPVVARKKRRSASIHRLMHGLRRVVGHSSGSDSPLRSASSVEYLDALDQHVGVTLSPAPSRLSSPRKRKSSDAFEIPGELQRDATVKGAHVTPSSNNKRFKVDTDGKASHTNPHTFGVTATTVNDVALTVTPATPIEAFKSGVKESGNNLSQTPRKPLHDLQLQVKDRVPSKLKSCMKSPRISVEAVQSVDNHIHFDREEPVGQLKRNRPCARAFSQVSFTTPSGMKYGKVKRRSCDVPLNGGAKRSGLFDDPVIKVSRRSSSCDWRSNGNEPDGADIMTLGPRGIPDGAECNLRDGLLPRPTVTQSLENLEQHYDDIKAVVKTMEAEVDQSNVQQMKETYFPNNSSSSTSSAQNMSYSEMIQNAYERMKVESIDLNASPSQNLSKRLDKELKIRNRKSGEHRVMRSPSERKIGTIRRRSRELVQNAAKSIITVDDTPKSQVQQTPKLKDHLIQTPVNGSLRRGKPNSVKSGLPFVVRTFSPVQNDEQTCKSANRMVIVSKRVDESNVIHPIKCLTKSNLFQTSNDQTNCKSASDLHGSVDDLPSSSFKKSDQNLSDNLVDSIVELLPSGTMTRRRSSLLSSMSSLLQFRLSENMNATPTDDVEGSSSNSKDSSPDIEMPMEMGDELSSEMEKFQDACVDMSDKVDEKEHWMPATQFNYVEEQTPTRICDGNGRPSLAALVKQKKVTANVQLFNNLHTVTPGPQQCQSQICSTPQQTIPSCSTTSERRNNVRLHYSKSMNNRLTMTPRELLKARQKSFQFDRSPVNLAKIAVVSPLKESTWINIQQEFAQEIPKVFKGEATMPQTPLLPNKKNMKPPVAPVTPVRSQSNLKIFNANQESQLLQPSNTPKLPPRRIAKPSPIRVQYR